MTLSREKWLRIMLTVLAVMIAPAITSSVLAQGYGADPFRPYNSQYDAYTYPMGPASPAGGGRARPCRRWATSAPTNTSVTSTRSRERAGREPRGTELVCPIIARRLTRVSTPIGRASIVLIVLPISLSSNPKS